MKAPRVVSVFLILVLLAISTDLRAGMALESYDITVPDDYSSIQEAIDAASPNHFILVRSGIYTEYIVINKTIHLFGEDKSTTVIEGNGTKVLIQVLANNVTLSGFSLKNAGTGILLHDVKNCLVKGNMITNFGIFDGGLSSGIGVFVDNCENITLIENFASDFYYHAIKFFNTDKSYIGKNVFIATMRWSQALFLHVSDCNVISWNDVLGLAGMNEGGIGLLRSNNNTISYNNIFENDWAGISVRLSNYTIVKGNNIANHSWWGMILRMSHNVSIYLNNFIDNAMQLLVESVENVSWYHDGYGNFWSDYTGRDNNNDGIGETPYLDNGEEIDLYPLVGKSSFWELSRDDERFLVEIISNSTIISAVYSPSFTSNGTIILETSGQIGTWGFIIMKLPHSLMQKPYNVTINGQNPLLLKELATSQDFTMLYFAYLHESEQEIIMVIQEFLFIPLILMLASILMIIKTVLKKIGFFGSLKRTE
ncbi:MAG: right-handed parallel beta-helix repeat-containing protein [Candidatus Bathyarchaeota archaeon]|nr:MAG: right-handed parallel beta-helix repeat-containing protein [Candidatus Bathyarchaeota archaeon]